MRGTTARRLERAGGRFAAAGRVRGARRVGMKHARSAIFDALRRGEGRGEASGDGENDPPPLAHLETAGEGVSLPVHLFLVVYLYPRVDVASRSHENGKKHLCSPLFGDPHEKTSSPGVSGGRVPHPLWFTRRGGPRVHPAVRKSKEMSGYGLAQLIARTATSSPTISIPSLVLRCRRQLQSLALRPHRRVELEHRV